MTIQSDPAVSAVAVTPSDSTVLDDPRALYIGVAGDVTVEVGAGGTVVLFTAHPVGYMPVQVTKVMATGTTATGIVALS
mgnify:CR=1 FL=1